MSELHCVLYLVDPVTCCEEEIRRSGYQHFLLHHSLIYTQSYTWGQTCVLL